MPAVISPTKPGRVAALTPQLTRTPLPCAPQKPVVEGETEAAGAEEVAEGVEDLSRACALKPPL